MFQEVKFVQFLGGTDIEDAITQAIHYAKKTNSEVKFDFNGVKMSVYEESDVQQELKYYKKQIKHQAKQTRKELEQTKEQEVETIYKCKLIMSGFCRSCREDSNFNVAFVADELDFIIRSELTCTKCSKIHKFDERFKYE